MSQKSQNVVNKSKGTMRKWFLRHPKLNPFEVFRFGAFRALTSSFRVLPDFIIIGAAKCGTTSLYNYMIQHPDIYQASRKEIHYFDLHRTGWYRSNFPTIFLKNRTKKNKKLFVTGEATPNYLFFPNVPKEVLKECPNAKFIVLLRNPIDRAYSHFQHQGRKNLVDSREEERENLSFDEAVEERLEGEWGEISKDKAYPTEEFRNRSYLSRGIYVDQLERWMKYFPKEKFLIIRTEEFNEDSQGVLNRIFNFVGVSEFKVENLKKMNAGRYENMDKSTRKYLVDYFKLHNQRLAKLLDVDFNWDS